MKWIKRELAGAALIVAVLIVCMCGCSGSFRGTVLNESDFSERPLQKLLASLSFISGSNNQGREKYVGLPEVDTNAWYLKLVNADNPIAENYQVELAENVDLYLFDTRAVDALDDMLKDGRSKGLKIVTTSAYRTYDYQAQLFEDKVWSLIDSGMERAEAEKEASDTIAVPGTSEHQIGLAADIVSEIYGILDEGYSETAEAIWLKENCAEYGFILRYPADKHSITGISFEPWHFRYVGKEAAIFIMDNDLCLEEFLELFD